MHSKHKGATAEGKVIADLYSQGYEVAIPIGDFLPFDVIAIESKFFKVWKVQVKWCPQSKKDGSICIELKNSMSNKTLIYKKRYTKIEVDVFAAYIPELDECIYISSDILDTNKSQVRFRTKEHININKNCRSRISENFRNFPGR